MKTYEQLKKEWEETADLYSLFNGFPEVFRNETIYNKKEHYQELQGLLKEAMCTVESWNFADRKNLPGLSACLVMLAAIIPEIDEEVFDHKMNAVRYYRRTLKDVLQVYGDDLLRVKRAGEDAGMTETGYGKALEGIRASICLACEHRVLIREKYKKYL